MTAEAINVYEAYGEALKAWDRIPKEFMSVELHGEYITYRCPKCDICFASVYNDGCNFRFNEPIICCGRLLQ